MWTRLWRSSCQKVPTCDVSTFPPQCHSIWIWSKLKSQDSGCIFTWDAASLTPLRKGCCEFIGRQNARSSGCIELWLSMPLVRLQPRGFPWWGWLRYGSGAPEVSSGKCEFCSGPQDWCIWLQTELEYETGWNAPFPQYQEPNIVMWTIIYACPHIFRKEVRQVVEVELGIHSGQFHGQKLQNRCERKGFR